MTDTNALVAVATIITLGVMYVCAVFNGVNGQVFTITTNALILIGTGKIILDQKGKIHRHE